MHNHDARVFRTDGAAFALTAPLACAFVLDTSRTLETGPMSTTHTYIAAFHTNSTVLKISIETGGRGC